MGNDDLLGQTNQKAVLELYSAFDTFALENFFVAGIVTTLLDVLLKGSDGQAETTLVKPFFAARLTGKTVLKWTGK